MPDAAHVVRRSCQQFGQQAVPLRRPSARRSSSRYKLAKRIVRTNPSGGGSILDQQSAMTLVQGTRTGYGKQTPEARRLREVTILDVYENAASVKIVAADWIDYLHLARWNGSWRIVNVLWELKPQNK